MARKTRTGTNVKADHAATIIEKIGDQVKTLLGRKWPEIEEILNDSEGDISISFGTTITDRKAQPGEHADKDNRIKTTISFSQKHTDKIESEIPDPDQTEMPLTGGEPEGSE